MNVEVKKKIEMLLAYKNVSKAELARKLGKSPQNFGQQLERQSLSINDLYKIGEVLDIKFDYYFEFEDGTKI